MKKLIALAIIVLVAIVACTNDGQENTIQKDEDITTQQQEIYQRNQPVHLYDFSQYRQTGLDIQDMQANGVATTTFFFNQGVVDPITSCPSIGYPFPSTAQLTNPDQIFHDSNAGYGTIPLMEMTGVYTGGSTGTYVVCVAENGDYYGDYWEGFVKAVGGPAHWDKTAKEIVLDGVAEDAVITNCADNPDACIEEQEE